MNMHGTVWSLDSDQTNQEPPHACDHDLTTLPKSL
jgi:hypothetical protein